MDEFLSRGREFRRELVKLFEGGNPWDVALPPAGGQVQPRGLLGIEASWAAQQLAHAPRQAIEQLAEPSPVGDLVSAIQLEALETLNDKGRWFVPAPAHVMVAGPSRHIRIGVFSWATDRDALLAELLGRPVPRHPRYAKKPPTEPMHLDQRDAAEWAEVWRLDATAWDALQGLDAETAAREAKALLPSVLRAAGDEAAAADLVTTVAALDAQGFARSPFGRLLLPIARGAPRWRRGFDHEWIWATDSGALGVIGFALWLPGVSSLYHHRAAYAAYLRYLFDHHVAPWRRHRDPRAQREAFLIHQMPRMVALVAPGTHKTVGRLADFARRTWPDDYASEPRETTLRRMYRLSGGVRRPLRAAGQDQRAPLEASR